MAPKSNVNVQHPRMAASLNKTIIASLSLGPRLALAAHPVLVAGQLLRANRSAGVQLAGGDADLGAHAELATVGELRRGVVHHDAGIDLVQEAGGGRGVAGDDRLGVVGAVAVDVGDGVVKVLDHL